MIDFRYHLVSLISVFLALAVGIVLGAGPLRETLGDELLQQVSQLREEKDALRVDRDTAVAGNEHRDDFVDAIAPALVGGRLTARRVVVVRLPGVEDNVLEPVTDSLTRAGATVTGTVAITDKWTNPDQRTLREQLAGQLAATVPGGVADAEDTDAQLAALLTRGLTTTASPAPVRPDAAATTVLSGLDGADLVNIDGDVDGLADLAVILVPGLDRPVNGVQPTPSAEVQTAYIDIARALDAGSRGAVVSGPASSAGSGGVLAAVRQDDAADRDVSTVDIGGTPMGVVAATLALREQYDGRTGRYGFGDGATAPVPAVAAGAAP